jgi:hypothetical protein
MTIQGVAVIADRALAAATSGIESAESLPLDGESFLT